MMDNGAVHVVDAIIRHVMSLASEYKVAEFFINEKKGIIIRNALKELIQPQPTMPLKTDNSTSDRVVNGFFF